MPIVGLPILLVLVATCWYHEYQYWSDYGWHLTDKQHPLPLLHCVFGPMSFKSGICLSLYSTLGNSVSFWTLVYTISIIFYCSWLYIPLWVHCLFSTASIVGRIYQIAICSSKNLYHWYKNIGSVVKHAIGTSLSHKFPIKKT